MGMTMIEMVQDFHENYDYLYSYQRVPEWYGDEYKDLIQDGEIFAKYFPYLTDEFINTRKDYLSSDREMAAYAMTIYHLAGARRLRVILSGEIVHDWETDEKEFKLRR